MKINLAYFEPGGSALRDAGLFLGLTFAVSWLFWLPGALFYAAGFTGIGNFVFAIGSWVPLVVAFYLNFWVHRQTFAWADWLRTLALRKALVAIVLPVLILVPIMLLRLYFKTFNLGAFLGDLRGAPFLFLGLLIVAFGEEVGWRGYLLPRLRGLNLVLVNLLIAFAWFGWQIPLVLVQPADSFQGDRGQLLAAFLLFSIGITPFLNRLALRSGMNVLLPALLRACLNTAFEIYMLQGGLDLVTHPYGVGVLVWLAALNLLLFGQLWQGKPSGDESELERVMPLEPAI